MPGFIRNDSEPTRNDTDVVLRLTLTQYYNIHTYVQPLLLLYLYTQKHCKSQWKWTGINQPCLLWIYCIYFFTYLNKTQTKSEALVFVITFVVITNNVYLTCHHDNINNNNNKHSFCTIHLINYIWHRASVYVRLSAFCLRIYAATKVRPVCVYVFENNACVRK